MDISYQKENSYYRRSMPTRPSPSPIVISREMMSDAFFNSSETTPSPMTFVASLLAMEPQDVEADEREKATEREEEEEEEEGGEELDDNISFSQLLAEAAMSPPSLQKRNSGDCISSSSGITATATASASANTNANSSFARRLAARNWRGSEAAAAPSAARYNSMSLSGLSLPPSPCLTIPPGLSPTTLLDSPVLLHQLSQAMPSPTTGNFPSHPLISKNEATVGDESRTGKDDSSDKNESSNCVFRPLPRIPSFSHLVPFGFSHEQTLQMGTDIRLPPLVQTSTEASAIPPISMEVAIVPSDIGKVEREADIAHVLVEKPSDDGYNWRKYGQKQVKGSEYPRSYYKCTYQNCTVKKKVERSYHGQITEIVYKGDHNHLKPQSTRRSAAAYTSEACKRDRSNFTGNIASFESSADAISKGNGAFLQSDNLSSISDSLGASHRHLSGALVGTPETSSGSTSDNCGDDNDRGSSRADCHEDMDEHNLKRRKMERPMEGEIETHKTVREPRVVVQTVSEIDILDDGYRWRKYGQKVVKDNPYPRSYYKCTNIGCNVRKQVERSSTDNRSVVTTYEGKHNHDVPVPKNMVNRNSGALTLHATPQLGSKGQGNGVISKGSPFTRQTFKGEEGRNSKTSTTSMPMNSSNFFSKRELVDMYTRMHINSLDSGNFGETQVLMNDFIVQPKEEEEEEEMQQTDPSQPMLQSALSFSQDSLEHMISMP